MQCLSENTPLTMLGERLQAKTLPAKNSESNGLPIVLIHGWASSSHTWKGVLEKINEEHPVILIDLPGFGASSALKVLNLSELLDQIQCLLPPKCFLMGWSLGGMLASALAARRENGIAGLITLATNPVFVATEAWPWAMSKKTYRDFCSHFLQEPLRTVKRFCGLQAQGDKNIKSVLKALKENQIAPSADLVSSWYQGLCFLEQLNNADYMAKPKCPGLHLFGEKDALVPLGSCEATLHKALGRGVARSIENIDDLSKSGRTGKTPLFRQNYYILKDTGHALHLSEPEKITASVLKFMGHQQALSKYNRSKVQIAQSFSRAAAFYDEAAELQKSTAKNLANAAGEVGGKVLDLACGTGFVSRFLKMRPQSSLLMLDLAQGMIAQARNKLSEPVLGQKNTSNKRHYVCGDMEKLPLSAETFDLVVSSMSVQWSNNISEVLAEVWATLKPGGKFIFTNVGPATLSELTQAWEKADSYVHVNDFEDLAAISLAAEKQGFIVESKKRELETLYYENVRQLMRSIKNIGAHNVNAGQNHGLTGKKKILALQDAYEKFRNKNGMLPATWEIHYFILRKNL